jgi:hypothetical protein
MRISPLSLRTLFSFIAVVVAASAHAYTQAEIDAAAEVAHDIGIVSLIASDLYEGRDNDTPGSTAVQTLLVDELKALGSGLNSSQTGDDAYKQPFTAAVNGTNLLAVITGSTLPNEYVMIGGHYDHLGTVGADIFNGATDNAASVALVLAVGAAINALPSPPRRSVILALWDAEEDGLVGSEYFSNNPLVPLSSIKGYVNLDIQGANLLPSLREVTLAVAAESGGAILQDMVEDASHHSWLRMPTLSRLYGQDRSDHANFIDNGVPVVFMSDATTSCYHTADDDPSVVDLAKLSAQSEISFRLMVELSEAAVTPGFVPTAVFDTIYEDAVIVLELFDRALVDLLLFPPADQTTIINQHVIVKGIVDAGPAAFPGSGLTVAIAALNLLTLVQNLPCDGFVLPVPVPASNTPNQVAIVLALVALGSLFARRFGTMAS